MTVVHNLAMLFDREVAPGAEGIGLWVPEERTTTPVNLFKIGFFAGIAFLVMAAMSEPSMRGASLFVGAFILSLLALTAVFLLWQRRYGEATLKAKSPLIFGKPFEGWIETELSSVPRAPVRVIFEGQSGKYVVMTLRQELPSERVRKDASGQIRIPFSFSLPPTENAHVPAWRIYVRAANWPLGWGATFLIPL